MIERYKRRQSVIGLTMLLLVIIGLVGVVSYFGFIAPQASTESSSSSIFTTQSLSDQLVSGKVPTLGSQNTAVTIVEFGDFQCPTCDYWFRTQEQQVIQNLISTNKAKLEWRDFDFYGPDSTLASEAAYAAWEQGKFWQFHDLLYSNQQMPNSGWASKDNLVKFAEQLGLNMTQFNASFGSGKYLDLIDSNFLLGTKAGVTGTPTFFVIGVSGQMIKIEGDQPYSVFVTAVNSLLGS